MKKLFFILIIMILNNYMCERNPSSPNNNNPFSIHLLKNSSFTISDIIETDIDDLEIKNEAWIEIEDIDFYDYSNLELLTFGRH